ncbi:hypothetical protein [Nocardioides sp.]|uniref:hypothetical protein n=1 Tax=Nocardioides sp. TaxID=35761 RepID=UPI00273255A4|nr:hypothetical protein [Nocardioides sp.]MDP3893104.1 hypothetical protein [Nocardioides sp.]
MTDLTTRRADLTGRTKEVVRPLWETTLRDPIRDGHLRLGGMNGTQRQLTKAGLVAIGLLLVSVLFSDVWRRGELLHLYFELTPTFVPRGLMPVTLVTLTLAWALLVWGALSASPLVKVFVGLLFGLTGTVFLAPNSINTSDTWILDHGPLAVKVGFYTVLGVLALSLGLHWLPRVNRWAVHVLRAVTLAAVAVFFLTSLWIHVAYVDQGFDSTVQSLVGGAIDQIDAFLLPLVYAAAVAVVKFGLDVSSSLATGLGELSERVVRWLVLALLLVKLWFVLGAKWSFWAGYVADRAPTAIRTVVSLVLLAVLVWAVTRFAPTTEHAPARERLIYGSSVALGVTFMLSVAASCAGIAALTIFHSDQLPPFSDWTSSRAVVDFGTPTLAAAAIVVGLWLIRRHRSTTGSELGSGLVVVGAWSLTALVLNLLAVPSGFSDALFDVTITLTLLVLLLVRWRRWQGPGLVAVAAVTVFAWLVMSRGDYIAWLGAILGLPAVLVTVFGIAYVVASDSTFAAASSKRLPQDSRVLLFVGYLLFSVTILHWNVTSHGSSTDSDAAAAFFYIGIPVAAWMLGRELVPRADELVDEEPLAGRAT